MEILQLNSNAWKIRASHKISWIGFLNVLLLLAIDHAQLVSDASKVLGTQLLSRPLLSSFMPEIFTIPELQKLYEAILGRVVDQGNFRQRIYKSDILIKIGTGKGKTKNRPPIIYRLNKDKYLKSLTQGVKLGF